MECVAGRPNAAGGGPDVPSQRQIGRRRLRSIGPKRQVGVCNPTLTAIIDDHHEVARSLPRNEGALGERFRYHRARTSLGNDQLVGDNPYCHRLRIHGNHEQTFRNIFGTNPRARALVGGTVPLRKTYTCISSYFPSRRSPPSSSPFLSQRLRTPSTAAYQYKLVRIIIAGSTAATAGPLSLNNAVMASTVEATNAAERSITTKVTK